MKYLNTIRRLTVVIIFVSMALASWEVFAQNTDIQKALRNSYASEAKGDYSGALKSVMSVSIADPSNYFLQLRTGYLNLILGQYNASLDAYENAFHLDSKAVEPALGALKASAALGNWAAAEKWANTVLIKDPGNYTALSKLAYSYFCRKDFAKAVDTYQKVIDLYPSDTTLKDGLAWSYFYMGNKSKARSLFLDVLAVNPDDASASQGLPSAR